MTKYSFAMTPTPCRVAGCIISIEAYVCAYALTYLLSLLTQLLWAYTSKTGISETVQDKAKLTINGP